MPVQHNKPNIVRWKKEDKQCYIIDISLVWDVHLTKYVNQTRDDDSRLAAELKRLYHKFTSEILPIGIGATRLVMNNLKIMLERIDIENTNDVTLKCQKSA